MSNLQRCECGGQPSIRGGMVSTKYWIECPVCHASTGLRQGLFEAKEAWHNKDFYHKPKQIVTLTKEEYDILVSDSIKLRDILQAVRSMVGP